MTAKRFIDVECENDGVYLWKDKDDVEYLNEEQLCELLNTLHEENKKLNQVNEMLQMDFAMTERNLIEENEQLKQFIKDLTTKGTGRIDLANGYSYRVSAVLTNWKGDVE